MPPRIGAYYAIHYGKEYLEHSIRSIYDAVDMIGVFYTELPSHGHRDTQIKNPDSREEVLAAIERAGDPEGKLFLQRGAWVYEFQHRDHAVRTMFGRGADIVLIVDSDEVWDRASLDEAICKFQALGANMARVNFLHFWRSFDWVCRCGMMPIRLQNAPVGTEGHIRMAQPVYHFGYAQRPEMVRYKASIHGHRSEWRSNWFEEKFLAFRAPLCNPAGEDDGWVGDVHPTARGIWFPEPWHKNRLPMVMHSHPYWNKGLIE